MEPHALNVVGYVHVNGVGYVSESAVEYVRVDEHDDVQEDEGGRGVGDALGCVGDGSNDEVEPHTEVQNDMGKVYTEGLECVGYMEVDCYALVAVECMERTLADVDIHYRKNIVLDENIVVVVEGYLVVQP